MTRIARWLVGTWVFVLVVGMGGFPNVWAGYKRIDHANPADAMAVHIYQLDNGLTVYLTENHQTPRFYAEIAVRAGSKHDPAESTGLAHYLEHMLFKGTEKMGTLDYGKEKPHLDRILDLYEQHFREQDAAKRKEIYNEINREGQLAAEYAIPNELDKLYKAMGGTRRQRAHVGRGNGLPGEPARKSAPTVGQDRMRNVSKIPSSGCFNRSWKPFMRKRTGRSITRRPSSSSR